MSDKKIKPNKNRNLIKKSSQINLSYSDIKTVQEIKSYINKTDN